MTPAPPPEPQASEHAPVSSTARSNRRRVLLGAGVTLLVIAALAATKLSASRGEGEAPGRDIAITHIHAAVRDPETNQILLATHQGLFALEDSSKTPADRSGDGGVGQHDAPRLELISPMFDLMGFTRAPDGTFYASGHAGAELDFDEPMGLISSEDGGKSWSTLSRGGESDFHGLAAGNDVIVGYDGELRATTDATRWQTLEPPAPPTGLALSPDGSTIAVAAADDIHLSRDQGLTWTTIPAPADISLVTFADDTTVVASSPEGELYLSEDAGQSWTTGGVVGPGLTSLNAVRTGPEVDVLAVTDLNVFATADLGLTVRRLV